MSEDYIQGDGCRFKREPIGLLPASILELDELRDEYKKRRSEAYTKYGIKSDEYKKWDIAQKTVKRMRATFYGLTLDDSFGWYDENIGKTITKGGRDALTSIAEKSEEEGFKVIYGDTDSIFVKLGDELSHEECAKEATKLAKKLTKHMRDKLRSDVIDVECETIMDKLLLGRAKKRYVGRIIWEPDTGLDIQKQPVEDRMKITGIALKQKKVPYIGKNVMRQFIKEIFEGKSIDESMVIVKNYIRQVREDFHNGTLDLSLLFVFDKINKSIPDQSRVESNDKNWHYAKGSIKGGSEVTSYYKSLGTQNCRAAAWHNIVLMDNDYPPIEEGDTFYSVFVNDGPTWIPNGGVIGFHDIEQISDYTIDIERCIQKNIIDPMDTLLVALGRSKEELVDRTNVFRVEDYIGL